MSEQRVRKRNIVTVSFLIGGTCIGGGMLALPVTTAYVGFLPATAVMLICWLFMTVTGLLILEANLWMEKGSHVITMASNLLGPIGKYVAWVIYLFVCYASLVAYTAAGGSLFNSASLSLWSLELSKGVSCTAFACLFGLVIYLGHKIVGRVNTLLFVAMIVAYFTLLFFGRGEVQEELLWRQNWDFKYSVLAIPLLLTSFSFQYIIPSLTPMVNHNPKAMRRSILIGTTIALLIYLLWQWLVMGTVPLDAPKGLAWAYQEGEVATEALFYVVNNRWIAITAQYFAFFALVTSFLGMAMGLFDFLADGLKLSKKGKGGFFIGLLVIVPTLYFAVNYSRIFLIALDTSGGFGDGILNGVMPVLMIWVGRYSRKLSSPVRLPGGKVSLVLVLLFSLFAIFLEAWELLR